MADMLCSLVRLPDIQPLLEKLKANNIFIRRPNPWDLNALREFIIEHFSEGWAQEAAIAFSAKPITCFIATKDDKIIGFGGYECTRRNYFGPTGVAEDMRGRGIGTTLLLACLYGLQDLGYTYAVIGGAGPVEFYKKAVDAIDIPFDEGKGIYGLKEEPRFMFSQQRPSKED